MKGFFMIDLQQENKLLKDVLKGISEDLKNGNKIIEQSLQINLTAIKQVRLLEAVIKALAEKVINCERELSVLRMMRNN